jgi:hypothetical protein
MHGLTVARGNLTADIPPVTDGCEDDTVVGGGGGGVAVIWDSALNDASGVFIDVVFLQNLVNVSVAGSNATMLVGGGGLLVAGGGNGTSVALQGCTFVGNSVFVTSAYDVACGGGVAIAVGFGPLPYCDFSGSQAPIMLGGSVAMAGVTASGNTIFCWDCFHGTTEVASGALVSCKSSVSSSRYLLCRV